MSTLKTTIKVESTDLFPTPVNFTVINNNTIGGDTSGFNYTVIGAATVTLNLTPVTPCVSATNVGGAYVYLKAKSSNTAQIFIDNVTPVAPAASPIVLGPGDVAFLRVGNITGASNYYAISTAAGQELEYFLGEVS
jgi:hypothetical protein